MKKLTSALVASSLVLGTMGMALAAATPDQQEAGYARMAALNLAKGVAHPDGTVTPDLDGSLTRAQLLTVIARAFGQENNAQLLNGLASFSDVPGGQWYSGYVAVAKQLATQEGFVVGYEDGTFLPNNKVTHIEALAFIMKFLGVPVGSGANWVADTIDSAQAAGVITDADAANYLDAPNAPATRGEAFALADRIFASYNGLPKGKTVYTAYVDPNPPALTLTQPASPTTEAATHTVRGVAEKDARVFVGGTEITPSADGSFSLDVALTAGENSITVTATDIAGNVSTRSITVTRVAGAAAQIEVAPSLQVAAGSETELAFRVLDATGQELADAATAVAVVTGGSVGTYADGVFTAAEQTGAGTITLSLGSLTATINVAVVAGDPATVKAEKEAVAPGESVRLLVLDAFGNAIEGAAFSEHEANAFVENGMFLATQAGTYTVTATAGGKSIEGTIHVFGEIDDLVIEVDGEIVANGETKSVVRVKAVDENDAVVGSFNGEVQLTGDFGLTVVSGSSVRAMGGVARYEVVATQDGEAELTAEFDEITVVGEVQVAAQKATALVIEGDDYLSVGLGGIPFEGRVKVVDQKGVALLDNDTFDTTLRVTGPAYLSQGGDRTDTLSVGGAGELFALYGADDEGTVTISAQADGLTAASKSVTAAYAGAPRKLAIAEDEIGTLAAGSTYKVALTDRNGVPVAAPQAVTIALKFNTIDISVLYLNGAALVKDAEDETGRTWLLHLPAGYQSATVTVKGHSNTPSQVTVSAASAGLTGADATIQFEDGEAAALKIVNGFAVVTDIDNDNDKDVVHAYNVRPDSPAEIAFQVVDAAGVAVEGSYRVEVRATTAGLEVNGKSRASAYPFVVFTDASGRGAVSVELPWAATDGTNWEHSVTFAVDADRNGSTDAESTVYVREATTTTRSMSLQVGTLAQNGIGLKLIPKTTFVPGEEVFLVLKVRDGANRYITNTAGDSALLMNAAIVAKDGTIIEAGEGQLSNTAWRDDLSAWIVWTLTMPAPNDPAYSEQYTVVISEPGSVNHAGASAILTMAEPLP